MRNFGHRPREILRRNAEVNMERVCAVRRLSCRPQAEKRNRDERNCPNDAKPAGAGAPLVTKKIANNDSERAKRDDRCDHPTEYSERQLRGNATRLGMTTSAASDSMDFDSSEQAGARL
jgi:hypothetical protein